MFKRLKSTIEEGGAMVESTPLIKTLTKAEADGGSSMMVSQSNPLLISIIVENLFNNTSLCNDLKSGKAGRLVCTLWNTTIVPMMCQESGVDSRNTIQIFKRELVKAPDPISAYNEFRSTMLSAPLGLFTQFSFNSEDGDFEIGELGEDFLSDFITSYGTNIKKLELPKNFPMSQLLTILKSLCPNLKELYINDFEFQSNSHWNVAAHSDVYISQILKKPLSLTRLSFEINSEYDGKISRKCSINALISIMKISPFLEELFMCYASVKFCYKLCKELKMLPEITSNLKSLGIDGNMVYADNSYTSSVFLIQSIDLIKLTQLNLYNPVPKTGVTQLLEKLSSTLERLTIDTEDFDCDEDYDELSRHKGPIQFPTLDKLTYLNLYLVQKFHPIESLEFLKKIPNLQNLIIKFRMATFDKESLSILPEMKALKKLKMGIYTKAEDVKLSRVNLEEFVHIPMLRNCTLFGWNVLFIGDEDLEWLKQEMKERNVLFTPTWTFWED